MQAAPVEPEVERTLVRAGRVAAEGDAGADAGGGGIEHEGELDAVGEVGGRPVVGEPDRRGLGVDAHGSDLLLAEAKAVARPSGASRAGPAPQPATIETTDARWAGNSAAAESDGAGTLPRSIP